MSNPLAPVLAVGQTSSAHINAALAAAMTMQSFTVTQLQAMTPSKYNGALVRCSNGAAGQPCLAYCDGTIWHQIALGTAVSAT